jgi:putative flippase GtrA
MREFFKKDSVREAVMYLFIGGLTTLVGLGSYWLVTRTFLNPGIPLQLQAANCISWVLAVAFAYVTNRIFVFRSSGSIIRELLSFAAARVVSFLVIELGISSDERPADK